MSEANREWSAQEVEVIKEQILAALDFDPENGETVIKMTLTTMGCPLADILTDSIHDALKEVPEVSKVEVKLVWYPAWTTDKMSRYARIALGIR